jgi:uncharacterized protein (TIGR02996 family)
VWIDLRESGFQKLENDYLEYGATTVEIVREMVAAGTAAQEVLRQRFGDREAQWRPIEEDLRPTAGVEVCCQRLTDEGRTSLAFAWVRGRWAYSLVGWVSASRPDAATAVVQLAHSLRFTQPEARREAASARVVTDRPAPAPPTPVALSSEEQALLQAVRDRADEDGPRWRYAAWLEERGDPRGQFMRVQCALQADLAGDQEDAYREQQRLLLERYGQQWLAPLQRLGLDAPRFSRGFVEQGTLAAAALVDRAEPLFRLAPLLRHLALRWTWVEIDRLAACPSLARIQSLDLSNEGQGSKLDAEHLARLLKSPYLGGMHTLNLSYNPLGLEGIHVLASSPCLAGLTALTLTFCGLDDDAARALAASAHLAGLRTLTLSGNITARGMESLAAAAFLPHLTSLNLWGCQLGDEGARILAASSGLAGLTLLALDSNGLEEEGAKALAGSKWLGKLDALVVSHNPLGDAGLVALAQSSKLAWLTTLKVREVGATADGLRTLLSSPQLRKLSVLDLDVNPDEASLAEALVESPVLAHLTDLSLSGEGAGDEVIELLATSRGAHQLRKLNLDGFALSDAGLEALLASPHLAGLRWLRLPGGPGISPNLRDRLRQRFRERLELV